jgi:sugar phosphate isomerase/epimerase
MTAVPFALQLYTVRDHMEKDPVGTLKAVKAAGYDNVELVGCEGYAPRDFKRILDDCGLRPISGHTGLKDIERDIREVVESAHTLGHKYLAFSANAPDRQGWFEVAEQSERAGEALAREGLRLCYHNHAHEYVRFGNETAYDIIMQNTSPQNLGAELDVFWVTFGGLDPVEQIRKYAHRCPLLHIKDMTADQPGKFAEVGRGIIDMPAVFEAGRDIGVDWYIVEQDECAGDSLESARISAEYMRKL